MLYANKKETFAKKILDRARDYGLSNPGGSTFDRIFNRPKTERDINVAANAVGQSKKQLSYPMGMSPDAYSSFASPTIGVNTAAMDPKRAYELIAQNTVQYFWRRNRERTIKYRRMASRGEISEALDSICNEAMYPNEFDEICSLKISRDAPIGQSVKEQLHKIFRTEVLRRLINIDTEGWKIMRDLLVEGRQFFEVVYDPKKNQITDLIALPAHNMVVVVQDGLIIGYREMLEGVYASSTGSGRNYIDFSPNQVIYIDLGLYGPGGLNDPRSILEEAVKPYNQLNCIEDAITMYRIQWGSEKMVFKIDTGNMPKAKAEKHMADQAKILSRRIDYNTGTGEITNSGRVIGLGEHFFLSTSSTQSNSSIERLESGDNISRVEDVKYFKRNLVNAMKVPPGHVSALAGDGQNYTNGKIGEVTQSEVNFSRMVLRYQNPMGELFTKLFVMILNTKSQFTEEIKLEEYFGTKFNKSNSFQLYIDSEVLNTKMENFEKLMKFAHSEAEPNLPFSQKFALQKGMGLTDSDLTQNEAWREIEAKEFKTKKK